MKQMNGVVRRIQSVSLCGVASLAALGCASAVGADGLVAEKGLAGIRILQSYKTVLNKYGQPDAVYATGEVVNMEMATDSQGNLTGGVKGAPNTGGTTQTAGLGGGGFGAGGMGGPGGMSGGKAGFMRGAGVGGPPGMGMARGMGGPPAGMLTGPPPGMMTGPGGGMGRPGMMGVGPGAGMGGPPGMMAGKGGMMGGGGMGAGSGSTFADAGGFIWVYFFPKKELAFEFYFNKDGRVEGILERGKSGGAATSHGMALGSSLKSLYTTYGWPDSIEVQGPGFAINYNQKYHTYFSVLNNNKVAGIAVFLRESQRVHFFDGISGGSPGMASGGMGGPGGMMGGKAGFMGGMPGMMGRGGMRGGMMGGAAAGGKEGD